MGNSASNQEPTEKSRLINQKHDEQRIPNHDPHQVTSSRHSFKNCCSIHYVLFVLWIILFLLYVISVLRLVMLAMLTYYHFKHTQNTVNDTREVGKFLRNFSVAGRIFEHLALIYGICRLAAYLRKNTEELRKFISCKQIKYHGRYLWKKCKMPCIATNNSLPPEATDDSNHEAIVDSLTSADNPPQVDADDPPLEKGYKCIIFTVLAIPLLVYAGVSVAPSIILAIYREKLVIGYKNNTNLAMIYVVTAGISYVSNLIARLAMIIVTLLVGNAWINKLESDKKEKNKKIEDLLIGYKKRGQAVAAIQRVFQDWFVIKWIVYFIDITAYSIIAIKSLFDDKKEVGNDHIIIVYSFLRLSYNFVAFLTLYICGTIMNNYHEKYCIKLEKTLRAQTFKCTCGSTTSEELTAATETCLRVPWDIQCAIASLRKPKYYFSPSLCGFSIPLNNSGYTLSILIALFAFIANYISTL